MTKLSYIDTGNSRSGDDEVLLFVHGIMMSKGVWARQIEYFSSLYRVIAIDLAGFGSSPKNENPANFMSHAADIIDLLDKLEIRKIHLAGWSMGGCIAIILARDYPQYITTLTLIDTTPKLVASDDFPWAIPARAAGELTALMAAHPQRGIAEFIEMIFPETKSAKIREPVVTAAGGADIKATLDHFTYSAGADLRAGLSRIRHPALIIHGTLDIICFPGASEYLARKMPHASLVSLTGLGHAPFLSQPGIFNQKMQAFIQNNISGNPKIIT